MEQVPAADVPVLEVSGVHKRFGGFEALSGVSLTVRPGRPHALIGPNGAGKTTLFEIVCGFVRPTAGGLRFRGRDITALPATRRAHLGICRTFQITTLFAPLTVFENLRMALEALPEQRRPFLASPGFGPADLAPHAPLLEKWGLWDVRHMPVAALPYGLQRQLEIVMAVLQRPRLLLLDEPVAGCEAETRETIAGLIGELSAGTNIVLIEHDMNVALQLSRYVTVLHHGAVLAEGTPEEIQRNDQVQRIYFGDWTEETRE